ncbi:hypothetical protein ACUZYJ_001813, partial [Campylobacter jejuni]|uniref:hypothetical protein n=4 Tax=Campylobacter jejuni TaxID=197 RepID=UPI0012783BC4|nr:hypothetical protein [Campylobacter jejuni]EAK2042687.1 hypothetical protein [Campylobacter jejuni]EAK2430770.1 hypothetical protein [Campylobacter jejuni]ECO3689343.1 hypothetical protein [Campylobacter jejuni]ECW9071872.1 hypothetical protein [Campylobacter jejuni]EDP3640766.1 hypothetical protein [Campylobacter jejuni]
MGEDITFSIFWGLVGFIFRLVTIDTILYITALSVLIAFSIINYWMRINIKEFVKSYFSIYFIIFFTAIIIIFYLSYDLETYRGYVMLGPPVSPQEYIVYKCSKFLIFINFIFFIITFFILPCLLQAYLFKCYSTGEKRKKLSWLIGFVCNIFLLIASVYVVYENL